MALAMFFWKTLKNRSNEIRSNEIRIRRGSPVLCKQKLETPQLKTLHLTTGYLMHFSFLDSCINNHSLKTRREKRKLSDKTPSDYF